MPNTLKTADSLRDSGDRRAARQIAVMRLFEAVGERSAAEARKILQLTGFVSLILIAGFRPRTWRRTIRNTLARQVLSSGVEAIGIVCFLALALGVLLVIQYQVWVGNILQSRLLAPVMVAVIVRELGPLLVNLMVIARSGNAITTELGFMQVSGEIRVLEGQGVETLHYFVIPRVFGLVISMWCLTLVFTAMSFLGVYLCGQWVGAKTGSFWDFVQSALEAIAPRDIANLFLKSTIPPLLVGSLCCAGGLHAGTSVSDVPRAARISIQRSLITLCIVTALISIGTYLRV